MVQDWLPSGRIFLTALVAGVGDEHVAPGVRPPRPEGAFESRRPIDLIVPSGRITLTGAVERVGDVDVPCRGPPPHPPGKGEPRSRSSLIVPLARSP